MTLKDLEEEQAAGLHPGYDSQLQQEDNSNNTTPTTISTNSTSPNLRRHNKSFHENNNVTLEPHSTLYQSYHKKSRQRKGIGGDTDR
jgi:hypothetical protein